MANLITLYWRDIPAQVIAERGRGRKREQAKIELPRRFLVAIDAAAMRDGVDSTDDYLSEWRRSEPEECSEDLEAEAAVRAWCLIVDSSRCTVRASASPSCICTSSKRAAPRRVATRRDASRAPEDALVVADDAGG